MYLEVKQLVKTFGGYTASDRVSFGIEKGRLIGLLGPSGGGKTTILRMLAGLETPDSGEIYIDGKLVNNVPAQRRGIGFVFQSYALFRHMTVYDNIAFGLTIQKRSKREIQARVSELIELTGLNGLEKRYPNQLSGGQRQRVAFARALAPEPHLLLLDEPFAAIDAKVRKELRSWLRATIERIGITTIFVTHDQDEAVEVADEIMIVNGGRLEQKGTPIDIYKNPLTPFVAGFIGESSRLDHPASLKGFEDELPDAKAIIRPEFVEIGAYGEISTPLAAEVGFVRDVFFRGNSWQIEAQIGSQSVSAYRSLEKTPLKAGDKVQVLIHRLILFNDKQSRIVENGMKTDPMPVNI
ncbi:sulfate/molybdate ABC transporter ATP-binding protein [Paenibacillus ginsengarvi]|uniref:Carnitine transport ATP-binding protein OpuCA n=1 Tax=Paenibacillus ginsengarvi TaxID=400777 RepID=A0A3B0CKZ4_9BACL|nr:ATP-binding cassette domain-containing protein [Paenibacillus ginsengarvi]RKN85398.1 ATP-binding cassette domain-containing protein [Paenibacillus ginsengarvi]